MTDDGDRITAGTRDRRDESAEGAGTKRTRDNTHTRSNLVRTHVLVFVSFRYLPSLRSFVDSVRGVGHSLRRSPHRTRETQFIKC